MGVAVLLRPEIRMTEPLPKGEIRTSQLKVEQFGDDLSEVLYVVHPSTHDGDFARVSQGPIQSIIDAQARQRTSRVIVIAPPQDCVYLRQGTRVNDIRRSASEYTWVEADDVPDKVARVKLVGGNLELCLASFFGSLQEIIDQAIHRPKQEERVLMFGTIPSSIPSARVRIDVDLPLNAIYTKDGTTAADKLHHLMQQGTPLEAIVALLTTPTPRTGYGQYAYGDYEIMSSFVQYPYEITLDGKSIATLSPKVPKPDESIAAQSNGEIDGWTRVRVILPPLIRNDVTYGLHLTTEGKIAQTRESETPDFSPKIKHAREKVLPAYDVVISK